MKEIAAEKGGIRAKGRQRHQGESANFACDGAVRLTGKTLLSLCL